MSRHLAARRRLAEVGEWMGLIEAGYAPPIGGIQEIRPHLTAAAVDHQQVRERLRLDPTQAPIEDLAHARVVVAGLRLVTASFDVKTAYLNAELEEEIYVKPLPVFPDETPEHVGKVFRLQRALYGLRQDGREWFLKFSSTMKQLGFTQSLADPGVYIKYKDDQIDIILIVYVDDIIAAGHGTSWIVPLRQQLEEQFDFVLVEGSDFSSDGSIIEFDLNIDIAKNDSKYFDYKKVKILSSVDVQLTSVEVIT